MITIQACLDGLLLGILFALIAYGMALQWGVMNIINIAQGDLVILGGYIAYFMYLYGIHPAWGVIVSPIIMYFVGIAIYKLVINKVVDRDLFISILATFGISILFMQLMNFAFGADVVLGNPFSKVEAPAFIEDVLRGAGPEFSVAMGIALRRLQELE